MVSTRGRTRTFRRLSAFAATAAVALGACADGTVHIAFAPNAGARYRYEIEVDTVSTLQIEGREPEERRQSLLLRAHHTVLRSGAAGTQVRVRLEAGPGQRLSDFSPRTFVVRLDRAAQLSRIDRVEGLPADVLGDFGLSEIFPAAAGAPPDRRLRPGDRWDIDEPIDVAGLGLARFSGHGRLAELGVIGGREVATIATETALELRGTSREPESRIEVTGRQHTAVRATHTIADGAVHEARSTSRGVFAIRLAPPDGDRSVALDGRLTVEITSRTTRLY